MNPPVSTTCFNDDQLTANLVSSVPHILPLTHIILKQIQHLA